MYFSKFKTKIFNSNTYHMLRYSTEICHKQRCIRDFEEMSVRLQKGESKI